MEIEEDSRMIFLLQNKPKTRLSPMNLKMRCSIDIHPLFCSFFREIFTIRQYFMKKYKQYGGAELGLFDIPN